MHRFHISLHDATPRYERETRALIQILSPLVGRRMSIGVVPDWHGEWPLTAHPDFCRLLRKSTEELILHGYTHQRQHGAGPIGALAGNCDEMNGLDPDQTLDLVERAQRVFIDAFGDRAWGFLPPAWQPGHVHPGSRCAVGLDYVLGYFTLESLDGRKVPLATCAWDCGRWAWLGYVGHGVGRVLHAVDQRVPVLAIHPRDLERGFVPSIIQLTRKLLASGYQPSTLAELLEDRSAERAA